MYLLCVHWQAQKLPTGPGDLSSLGNSAWLQLKAGQLPESGVSLLLLSKVALPRMLHCAER